MQDIWWLMIGYGVGTLSTLATCYILAGRGRGPWA